MLRAALLLAVGYVLGAKAGRERYAQIEGVARSLAEELGKRGLPTIPDTGAGRS